MATTIVSWQCVHHPDIGGVVGDDERMDHQGGVPGTHGLSGEGVRPEPVPTAGR